MKADRTVFLLTLTLCLGASWDLQAQDPRGSELRVNQHIAGMQWLPDVATAADGRFVVVWEENTGTPPSRDPVLVKARLFDATGKPRSGEIQVARARHTYRGPLVDMAPDGRFIVVWEGGTENPAVVFGRRFAADGRPLGPRFRLARSTELSQSEPDVALASDGSFAVVWSQYDGGISSELSATTDIMFRRFGADGRPLGPETMVIGGHEEQSAPRIAMRASGQFVVVCQSYGTDGAFFGILARLFSRTGAPAGDEFLVNDGPNASEVSQYEPSVAMAANGRFAVVWTDRAADFDRDRSLESIEFIGVAARLFAADGTPLGPSFFVNDFLPGIQENPSVSALQNGGFLLAWTSGGGQDGDGSGIFARVYGPTGKPLGHEVRINLNRTGSQFAPALSIAPNGKGAAAWISSDGDSTGIFARLFGIPRS